VAVQAGQHHIKDDHVDGSFGGVSQPLDAVVGDLHDVALGL
jgi:hypothetical protein